MTDAEWDEMFSGPYWNDPVTVRILDTHTGVLHTRPPGEWDEFTEHWWAEGNGSCDCNRAQFCGVDRDKKVPCSTGRFVVVDDEGNPRDGWND